MVWGLPATCKLYEWRFHVHVKNSLAQVKDHCIIGVDITNMGQALHINKMQIFVLIQFWLFRVSQWEHNLYIPRDVQVYKE